MTYNPFEAMKVDYKHCFLCGVELTDDNSTDEHIFPKWLLNKYSLWDTNITLLNGSDIKYNDLKSPCCKECNNKHLSTVEKIISEAVNKGFESFNNLDDDIISRWLLKLSYGLLFKELSLNIDRRDPSKGKIVTNDFIKSRNIVHILLQGIKCETKFAENKPWSLIKYEIIADESEDIFDCGDIVMQNYIYVRMNDIGIIFCYGDNGIGKQLLDESYGHYKNIPLHPIQFYELCAKSLYKQELLVSSSNYMMIENGSTIEIYSTISNLSSESHKPWNQHEYFKLLRNIMIRSGYNVQIDFNEPDLVTTFLYYNNLNQYIQYKSLAPNDIIVHSIK